MFKWRRRAKPKVRLQAINAHRLGSMVEIQIGWAGKVHANVTLSPGQVEEFGMGLVGLAVEARKHKS